ncbi:hypothetical protein NMY3_02047 [Candidatus Nitrosocosmicus oleophilus]|uniref:Uncharacterized protein n=1 Tax=Candidatus Nitrosocosmicus oleophilus TaxID=1353260 RepID=A0A654M175_9ARCH|nr:hypothetical protein NMY3_02047 [Candidatus Nitrosocosmicus oleophilus]
MHRQVTNTRVAINISTSLYTLINIKSFEIEKCNLDKNKRIS